MTHVLLQLLTVNAFEVGKQLHVLFGCEVLPQNIVLGGRSSKGGEGPLGEGRGAQQEHFIMRVSLLAPVITCGHTPKKFLMESMSLLTLKLHRYASPTTMYKATHPQVSVLLHTALLTG